MGLDSRFGLFKMTSTMAEYEALENLVIRKTTQMRWDRGFIIGRLFDDAFDVLSLTYT